MGTPRLKVLVSSLRRQGPEDELVAPVRDRLAMERQKLDTVDPGALDMAAGILVVLHQELRGDLTNLAGDRPGRYRRGQLLGEHGLPLEDLCYLHRQRPETVSRALRPLTAEPQAGEGSSVGRSGAALAEQAGRLAAELIRALEDGRLTLAEVSSLERDLDSLEQIVREARAALIRRRP